jgi:hypothetical protein
MGFYFLQRTLSTHPPLPAAKAGQSSGLTPCAQRWQFVVPVKLDQSGLGRGGGGFSHPAAAIAVGHWWWEQGIVGPAGKALAPRKPILAQAGRELGMQAGCILAQGQERG